jgi:radical SAM-linked protein
VIDRPDGPPDEPRQRWRIVFAREAPAPGTPSEAGAWEAALASAGLPVARSLGKSPRARLSVAAALPTGVSGEAELADLVLTERLTAADVRTRLGGHLPEGHRLVELFDIWLGAPTVMAQLAAADYRVVIGGASPTELANGCAELIAATSLERTRQKGDGRAVAYDLRPQLLDLSAEAPPTLTMRLRHAQDGPAGRPEEVVLALGESIGRSLELGPIVRERLLTAEMLEDA